MEEVMQEIIETSQGTERDFGPIFGEYKTPGATFSQGSLEEDYKKYGNFLLPK
jgi:hypothetical protein